MKNKWIFLSLVSLILVFGSCTQGDGDGETPPPDNPIPVLNTITPNSKVSHLPSFTLTATGSSFVSNSQIIFNGSAKQTSFVSATELTCQIDPADISSSAALTTDSLNFTEISKAIAIVLVRNPSPGGGDSNSKDFSIQSNHTFYVPKNISNNSGHSYSPIIATDSNGNLNVTWHDRTPGAPEIFYKRSEDSGSTWTQHKNISNNSGSSYTSDNAICDSGNIHVVWYDNTPGNYEILYRRSEDNGNTWSQKTNISNSAGLSYVPAIATDSAGNIHVVWYDTTYGDWEILYTKSEDNGSTWTQPTNLSDNTGHSYHPDIATDSAGNINVVWEDTTPTNRQILFTRSEDGGSTWIQPKNVSNTSDSSENPAISTDSAGNIFVIWHDKTPGNFDILFSRSTDSGSTWIQPKNVSNNTGNSYSPVLSTDSAGNINVVWFDTSPGNRDILYSRSINNGGSWTQPLNIANTSGDSYTPTIANDSA